MTLFANLLTHWGRVTHICVSKFSIFGSDNGLSPGRRQAIIQTNAGILLIWPLGTNFSEILIEINTFSFKKMHLKMPSGKWSPFCLGLNVLKYCTKVHQPHLNHQWRYLPDLKYYSTMMSSSNGNIFRATGHLWGEPLVTGGFSSQRPVTRSFDVFFDLHQNQ